jgi:SAM-dependent methyltransferase
MYALPEFEVVECRTCSAAFINAPIENGQGFAIEYGLTTDPVLAAKARKDFQELKSVLLRSGAAGVHRLCLLDIGCGIGSFLLGPAQEGWPVAGLELSSSAAQYAGEERGLNVQPGSIEDGTSFPSAQFDVITMYGVIEHLRHPRKALDECARLLKPQGFLVIQTPNGNGLMRRAGQLIYRATDGLLRFQVKEFFQMGGGHSVCFNRRSIDILLATAGFSVISIRQSTYGLRILLQRFGHLGLPARAAKCLGTSALFALGQMLGASNHMTVYARKE